MLGLWVSGCGGCEQVPLRVQEPFPHLRCLAADPSAGTQQSTLGALNLVRDGHEFRIDGAPEEVRIAVFAGPGPAAAVGAQAVAALAERKPTVALMLGGLGDDDTTVADSLTAFSKADFPTLFVPGGRDNWVRYQALWARQPPAVQQRFFELATTHLVRLGRYELVPVAGSANGRYALDGDCCGYTVADLQARARALPEPQGPRYLVAWQAPGRGGALAVGRSATGLDLGSDALSEMALRVAAPGGLFAWPANRVDEPVVGDGAEAAVRGVAAPDLRVVVPRLTGPALRTDQGGRVPAGFIMVALGPEGMRYLGRVALDAL